MPPNKTLHIYNVCVCIHYCLVKILQWLLSAFRMPNAILCLNMPKYNACRFGECWYGTFRSGGIWVARKRSVHPWESEGAHLLLLFSEAPIRADLLWEQGLLRRGAPMQMKSVASCLLDFKDFQAHDATGEKKNDSMSYTCCSFMCTVAFLSAILKLIWTKNYSNFLQWLFSWKDSWISVLASVWILDSSLLGLPTKPYINLLSIANDSDHTVTRVRHSTYLTGSCQKDLSFCQPHSLATTVDCMFSYKAFWSCSKGRWG